MESKQKAFQEKKMAETLMRIKDYNGAKEKLLRARRLFPQLQNINSMLTVCDILLSAAASPNSPTTDWYWVLQTDSNAHESHITTKYQKLTSSLDPLKNNKFPGTDSALTVLHNAFSSVLSNCRKREAFELETSEKSDLRELCPKTPTKLTTRSAVSKPDVSYFDFRCNTKSVVFEVGQIWATYDHDDERMPRCYARITWIIRSDHLPFQLGVTWLKPLPTNKNERMWCEAGLPVGCGGFALTGTSMVVSVLTVFSHMVSRVQGLNIEICPKKGEVWAVFEDWRPFQWCEDPKTRKGCGYRMVEILVDYSKQVGLTVAHLAKVAGFRSVFQRSGGSTFIVPPEHLLRFSHNVPAYRFKGGEIGRVSDGMLELDPLAVPDGLVECMTKSSRGMNSSDCSSVTDHAPVSLLVDLDPEVISIQCKWSRKDFTSDQVWAVYDGTDCMPRRYVIVKNVISGTEVCVTFLEPHPFLDDEKYWVEEMLPFVCGLFRAGRITVNLGMSQFSHVVICDFSTTKSSYRIYPKKGEVWAMYQNWHPKWRNCDYIFHQCQIVEVISDFSEGAEMSITCLVEVNDCMTFFQRQLVNGFELVRTIPRLELLSFSHQIPCFTVLGIGSRAFPEGYLHLEPDALPPRLAK